MKTYSRQDLLTVALLLGFLFSQALAYTCGLRSTEIENRKLTPFPRLSLALLASVEPGAQVSAFIKDRLPLRPKLLSAHNWLVYYLLGDVPGKLLLLGKDDWLFLRRTVAELPGTQESDPAVCLPLYDRLIECVLRLNIRPLVVISPNKVSLYPEFLRDGDRDYRRLAELRQAQLEKHFAGRLKDYYLNLWPPLRSQKQLLLRRPASNWTEGRLRFLFRPRDRHWHYETALIQAQQMVERLSPGQLSRTPGWELTGKYTNRPSEFSSIPLGFDLPEAYAELGPKPEGLTQKEEQIGASKVQRFSFHHPGVDRRHLVVIHDSFIDTSIPFLVTHFANTTFVHWWLLRDRPDLALPILLSANVLVVQTVDDARQETRHNLIRALIRRLQSLPPVHCSKFHQVEAQAAVPR